MCLSVSVRRNNECLSFPCKQFSAQAWISLMVAVLGRDAVLGVVADNCIAGRIRTCIFPKPECDERFICFRMAGL